MGLLLAGLCLLLSLDLMDGQGSLPGSCSHPFSFFCRALPLLKHSCGLGLCFALSLPMNLRNRAQPLR